MNSPVEYVSSEPLTRSVYGAGEGIRTLDFNLGKVAEYMVCLLFTEYWNNICKKINIF